MALVTDGRMSGASGKVPAAIHVSPEASDGGLLARLQDGDLVRVDAVKGTLNTTASNIETRPAAQPDLSQSGTGMGRELFAMMRQSVGSADKGACVF